MRDNQERESKLYDALYLSIVLLADQDGSRKDNKVVQGFKQGGNQTHVLARVETHVLARVETHVLARVVTHMLARVIMHVHDYYLKTCLPGAYSDRFPQKS